MQWQCKRTICLHCFIRIFFHFVVVYNNLFHFQRFSIPFLLPARRSSIVHGLRVFFYTIQFEFAMFICNRNHNQTYMLNYMLTRVLFFQLFVQWAIFTTDWFFCVYWFSNIESSQWFVMIFKRFIIKDHAIRFEGLFLSNLKFEY